MPVPKGVSKEKFKRCEHKVMAQGKSLSSAIAICFASLKKSKKG
jgi:uncharacterized protein YoaH (UPF0181 family)